LFVNIFPVLFYLFYVIEFLLMTDNKTAILKVGIIILTLNRPDFVIRQLKYYAKLNSPHPVYISDAGNDENSKKLQSFIEKIDKDLTIFYYRHPKPAYSMVDSYVNLYDKVREKYCVFSGDDDYQIPRSLIKCAEFLENNPDYSNASGYAVSFRLVNNGVYGVLNRLADYPRRQIESSSAANRLMDFMSRYYVPLFSVYRTEEIKKCWSQSGVLKDWDFSNEILASARALILGKSKIIDCLSFVRQIHNIQYQSLDTFDWIMSPDWHSSFESFIKILTEEIAAADNIGVDEARQVVKEASWRYLVRRLSKEYADKYGESAVIPTIQNRAMPYFKIIKFKISKKLPWLKNFYRQRIRPLTKALPQIHDDVLRKGSKYYDDFKPVMNSFTDHNSI